MLKSYRWAVQLSDGTIHHVRAEHYSKARALAIKKYGQKVLDLWYLEVQF